MLLWRLVKAAAFGVVAHVCWCNVAVVLGDTSTGILCPGFLAELKSALAAEQQASASSAAAAASIRMRATEAMQRVLTTEGCAPHSQLVPGWHALGKRLDLQMQWKAAAEAYTTAMATATAAYKAESGLALELASILLEIGRSESRPTNGTGAFVWWSAAAAAIAHADQALPDTLYQRVHIHVALHQHSFARTAFLQLEALVQRENEKHGASTMAISNTMLRPMLPLLLGGGNCEDAIRVSERVDSQCLLAAANPDDSSPDFVEKAQCRWEAAAVKPICAAMAKGNWSKAVAGLHAIEGLQEQTFGQQGRALLGRSDHTEAQIHAGIARKQHLELGGSHLWALVRSAELMAAGAAQHAPLPATGETTSSHSDAGTRIRDKQKATATLTIRAFRRHEAAAAPPELCVGAHTGVGEDKVHADAAASCSSTHASVQAPGDAASGKWFLPSVQSERCVLRVWVPDRHHARPPRFGLDLD